MRDGCTVESAGIIHISMMAFVGMGNKYKTYNVKCKTCKNLKIMRNIFSVKMGKNVSRWSIIYFLIIFVFLLISLLLK